MLGFGSIGQYSIGEYSPGVSEVIVAYAAANIDFAAALAALAGVVVPIDNTYARHNGSSIGELAIGEVEQQSFHPSNLIDFRAPNIQVVARLKKPSLQIIES